jgi:hypothetical protein
LLPVGTGTDDLALSPRFVGARTFDIMIVNSLGFGRFESLQKANAPLLAIGNTFRP